MRSKAKTLTVDEWSIVDELLTVAIRHVRSLSDDALHTRISRPLRIRLEDIADRGETVRAKLQPKGDR